MGEEKKEEEAGLSDLRGSVEVFDIDQVQAIPSKAQDGAESLIDGPLGDTASSNLCQPSS